MPVTLLRYWCNYFKQPRQAQQFERVFQRASAAGWRSYLVCSQPPDDPKWLEPILAAGAEVIYTERARGNFNLACIRKVYRLCRELHCDIIHCDNVHTSPLIAAALAGVPLRLWSKRSMEPAYEMIRSSGIRDRVSISLHVSGWLATRTLAVSKAVRQEMTGRGIPSAKVIVQYNPVQELALNGLARNAARDSLGYGDTHVVITTVGQALPVKGWDVLIRAFATVAEEFPKARLLLVGSHDKSYEREWYAHLRRLICDLRLNDRVQFVGHVAEIESIYVAADIFVLPSRSEGYSFCLIEAMTAGLPCVSTQVGVAPEVITDGQNGFLTDREDVGQLATALRLLAEDPEMRRRLSRNVKIARKGESREEFGDRLFDLYVSLLSTRRRSRVS